MNTTGKIQSKGQVTIPTSIRRRAGVSKGDLVSFAFQRGKIVITPNMVIDRSKFPTADDGYTPEQRRVIDARLAEGLADIKAGRTFGPFDTADEMIAHMKRGPRKNAASRRASRSR